VSGEVKNRIFSQNSHHHRETKTRSRKPRKLDRKTVATFSCNLSIAVSALSVCVCSLYICKYGAQNISIYIDLLFCIKIVFYLLYLSNIYMSTDILQFSQTGNLDGVIKCLQQNKDTISTRDSWGGTALHWACDRGHVGIVDLLLQSGAEKDDKTHQNMTPLHCACSAGHLDVVRVLLRYGADKDAKNRDGWAPIHYAADDGHLMIVQLLVDKGADKNAKCRKNCTALLYAQSRGFSEIVAYLNTEADAEVAEYKVFGKYPFWPFVWSTMSILCIYAGSMSMIAIGVTWLYSATTVCGVTVATAQFSISTDSTFRHFSGNSCPGYDWFAKSDPYKAGYQFCQLNTFEVCMVFIFTTTTHIFRPSSILLCPAHDASTYNYTTQRRCEIDIGKSISWGYRCCFEWCRYLCKWR
jgi:hypothetical protein